MIIIFYDGLEKNKHGGYYRHGPVYSTICKYECEEIVWRLKMTLDGAFPSKCVLEKDMDISSNYAKKILDEVWKEG